MQLDVELAELLYSKPKTESLSPKAIEEAAQDLHLNLTRAELAHVKELSFRDLADFTSFATEYTADLAASKAYRAELDAEEQVERERVAALKPLDAAREVVEAYLRAGNPFA